MVKRVYWLLLILIMLTTASYIRGINNQLVAEDFEHTYSLQVSPEELLQEMLKATRPRPVTFGLYWLVVQLFDVNVVALHLVSIVFHIGVTLLFFLLVRQLSNRTDFSFWAALIFAVYPRHHQNILWYASSPTLFMTFLVLIAVLAFLRYLVNQRQGWFILSNVCMFFAMLAQEAAIFFVPILFITELMFYSDDIRRKLRTRRFYYKYIIYGVVLMGAVLLSFGGTRILRTISEASGTAQVSAIPGGDYGVAFGAQMIQTGLGYLVYWAYPHIPLRSLNPNLIGLLLTASVVILLAILFIKGTKLIRFAIVWSLITLAPYIIFVPFGNADRYFYIPAIGWSLIVVEILRGIYKRLAERPQFARTVFAGIIGAYLVSAIVLIQIRIDEWKTAGEIAAAFVAEVVQTVPDPPTGSTIVLLDYPTDYRQVYVFTGGGADIAVRAAYDELGKMVHVVKSREPAIINYFTEADPVAQPLDNYYVVLYQEAELLDKSNTIDEEALETSGVAALIP